MRYLSTIAVALLVIGVSVLPAEAELTLRPQASTRAYYDNNPRLQEDPATEVMATVNEIRVESLYSRPTYLLSLTPRFRLSRYTEETALDAEDRFVELTGQKFFERSQLFSEFRYEREASFTTELEDSDRFNVNVPRTTFALELSWSFAIDDKTTATVFGNALDVSFDDPPRFTLIDYLNFGTGVSLSRAISDQTSLVAVFSVAEFKTPQVSSETFSYSYQVGFEHQFDDTLSASFRIGNNIATVDFNSTRSEIVSLIPFRVATFVEEESASASGEIINLSAEKEFKWGGVRLEWNRSFSPSSFGSRRRDQRVGGLIRYRFNRFLVATVDTTYRESRQDQENTLLRINEREVLTVRSQLRYLINRHWRAELGFQFREVNRLRVGRKTDSERIFMALYFEPKELRY